MLVHWLIYWFLKTALYIRMMFFKCMRHNDPVMQVKSLPSLFVERSICLAHYSHIAITQTQRSHFGGNNLDWIWEIELVLLHQSAAVHWLGMACWWNQPGEALIRKEKWADQNQRGESCTQQQQQQQQGLQNPNNSLFDLQPNHQLFSFN